MPEDYSTSAKINSRCRVVFLGSFISALFLYFFQVHLDLYLKGSLAKMFSHSTMHVPFLTDFWVWITFNPHMQSILHYHDYGMQWLTRLLKPRSKCVLQCILADGIAQEPQGRQNYKYHCKCFPTGHHSTLGQYRRRKKWTQVHC